MSIKANAGATPGDEGVLHDRQVLRVVQAMPEPRVQPAEAWRPASPEAGRRTLIPVEETQRWRVALPALQLPPGPGADQAASLYASFPYLLGGYTGEEAQNFSCLRGNLSQLEQPIGHGRRAGSSPYEARDHGREVVSPIEAVF